MRFLPALPEVQATFSLFPSPMLPDDTEPALNELSPLIYVLTSCLLRLLDFGRDQRPLLRR